MIEASLSFLQKVNKPHYFLAIAAGILFFAPDTLKFVGYISLFLAVAGSIEWLYQVLKEPVKEFFNENGDRKIALRLDSLNDEEREVIDHIRQLSFRSFRVSTISTGEVNEYDYLVHDNLSKKGILKSTYFPGGGPGGASISFTMPEKVRSVYVAKTRKSIEN